MMRLKGLFTPVKSIDTEEAKNLMEGHEAGTIALLDVRQPAEYEEAHIPGAKLVPLPDLHHAIDDLDPERPTIVHCAVGGRSRVGAQLLTGLGFKEVYNLKGGIKAWQGFKASGPKELNLDLVRGDESPVEVLALAYGMEDCLGTFYEEMHDRTDDQEVRELFAKLDGIEEKHKRTILELSVMSEGSGKSVESSGGDGGSVILEGGFDMVEFMEQNEPNLKTVPDVIELAMMLETQALDLYLRFADKSTNPAAKKMLFKIAQEEKGHLAALGRLMEEKIKEI